MHSIRSEKKSNFDVKVWYFIVFGIFFLSVMRGIRFPNIWSYTHFLFNYSLGFVKRGLIGEIISQLNYSYLKSYDFFLIFSTAIFLINIFLLSLLLWDFINSQKPIFLWSSLLFSSSLAVVFLSHSIGYFDHIGLLITLIALKLRGFNKKIVFLLIAMPFGILVHEINLIIFFPIIFMLLVFALEADGWKADKVLLLGSFSAVVLILTVFIGNHNLTESEASQMYNTLQANIQYPLREDAFDTLCRNANDNLNILQSHWSSKTQFLILSQSLLVTSPTFTVFICFSCLILIRTKIKYYLIVLSILASLSPLLMHFLGWDMHRWNTLAATTSFLMLYIVYTSRLKDQDITTPNYFYLIVVLLIFLNGSASIPLFDGYYVKQFPFVEHQQYIIDLVYGREVFPYVPNR